MESTDLPLGVLQVQLNQTYQHGAGFSDDLRYQAEKEDEVKPQIIENIRDVESGKSACNIAGQADSYVFALS